MCEVLGPVIEDGRAGRALEKPGAWRPRGWDKRVAEVVDGVMGMLAADDPQLAIEVGEALAGKGKAMQAAREALAPVCDYVVDAGFAEGKEAAIEEIAAALRSKDDGLVHAIRARLLAEPAAQKKAS